MSEYVAERVLGKTRAVTLKDLPFEVGDKVKISIERVEVEDTNRLPNVRDLLDSGLIGIWEDRDDIGDTLQYARKLREEVSTPRVTIHDFD